MILLWKNVNIDPIFVQFSHSENIYHHFNKRSTELQNLRISVEYDDSVKKLGNQKENLVKNTLIEEAIKFWNKALKVKKPLKKLLLTRLCKSNRIVFEKGKPEFSCLDGCKEISSCGNISIPEYHLKKCRVAKKVQNWYETHEEGTEGSGILDRDFILYVSAKETNRCGERDTIAYAAFCHQDALTDR
ncbi:DgyrCDS1339 [Dimorphilus gyrociliatus]|uniref:DgyrCDS1339 n=1 Tax=Dimorphilus gyrociliatus TaxID=2664684 RepID=A0A7I8V744_9ANNE|nr:DgyrCDS1339 [Dimorphilus gyrociliatus]